MTRPFTRLTGKLLLLGVLTLAGCSTATQGPPVVPVATRPIAPATERAAGDRTMLVETDPAGAIIVVNGRPVGRAPLRLAIPATAQGFFLNYLEVRARFLAAGEGQDGHTTVVSFTPLERVPVTLSVTPTGSHRAL